MVPCVLFEDDHLLAINKPAGLNTHSPAPYAGEGIFEWLKNREPRWANLAIIHRLDKETSGVILFSKTAVANRSLTEQFSRRAVRKTYRLLTDRLVPKSEFRVESSLVRAGERYLNRPPSRSGQNAETVFKSLGAAPGLRGGLTLVEAQPFTGRTHQIRVHATASGLPILGDSLYNGSVAPRVYLHARRLELRHPVTGKAIILEAPEDFDAEPRLALRRAFIVPHLTNAFRLVHGAADHSPGLYVERLGEYLVAESGEPLSTIQREHLARVAAACQSCGIWHKLVPKRGTKQRAPQEGCVSLDGRPAPPRFSIMENGLKFLLSFEEGLSSGLFLDQRDNRRRLLTRYVASGFALAECRTLLNTFAYTCGFSVAAAAAGIQTASLDLSKKYLEWGKANFAANQLSAEGHEFIAGDTFDWLRRWARRGRSFDLVMLDPPTFSRSHSSGVLQAAKDYPRLVMAALAVLKPGGILFASTNSSDWPPEDFMVTIQRAVAESKREILQRHYVPQPADFPISRLEPAYLKTCWLQLR